MSGDTGHSEDDNIDLNKAIEDSLASLSYLPDENSNNTNSEQQDDQIHQFQEGGDHAHHTNIDYQDAHQQYNQENHESNQEQDNYLLQFESHNHQDESHNHDLNENEDMDLQNAIGDVFKLFDFTSNENENSNTEVDSRKNMRRHSELPEKAGEEKRDTERQIDRLAEEKPEQEVSKQQDQHEFPQDSNVPPNINHSELSSHHSPHQTPHLVANVEDNLPQKNDLQSSTQDTNDANKSNSEMEDFDLEAAIGDALDTAFENNNHHESAGNQPDVTNQDSHSAHSKIPPTSNDSISSNNPYNAHDTVDKRPKSLEIGPNQENENKSKNDTPNNVNQSESHNQNDDDLDLDTAIGDAFKLLSGQESHSKSKDPSQVETHQRNVQSDHPEGVNLKKADNGSTPTNIPKNTFTESNESNESNNNPDDDLEAAIGDAFKSLVDDHGLSKPPQSHTPNEGPVNIEKFEQSSINHLEPTEQTSDSLDQRDQTNNTNDDELSATISASLNQFLDSESQNHQDIDNAGNNVQGAFDEHGEMDIFMESAISEAFNSALGNKASQSSHQQKQRSASVSQNSALVNELRRKSIAELPKDSQVDLAAVVQNVMGQMVNTDQESDSASSNLPVSQDLLKELALEVTSHLQLSEDNIKKPNTVADMPQIDENIFQHFQNEAHRDEEEKNYKNQVADSNLKAALASAVRNAIESNPPLDITRSFPKNHSKVAEESHDADLENLQMNLILQNAFNMAMENPHDLLTNLEMEDEYSSQPSQKKTFDSDSVINKAYQGSSSKNLPDYSKPSNRASGSVTKARRKPPAPRAPKSLPITKSQIQAATGTPAIDRISRQAAMNATSPNLITDDATKKTDPTGLQESTNNTGSTLRPPMSTGNLPHTVGEKAPSVYVSQNTTKESQSTQDSSPQDSISSVAQSIVNSIKSSGLSDPSRKPLTIAETLALHRSSMSNISRDYSSIASLDSKRLLTSPAINPQLSQMLSSLSSHINSTGGSDNNLLQVIRQMTNSLTSLSLRLQPFSSTKNIPSVYDIASSYNDKNEKEGMIHSLTMAKKYLESGSKEAGNNGAVSLVEKALDLFNAGASQVTTGILKIKNESISSLSDSIISSIYDYSYLKNKGSLIVDKPSVDSPEYKNRVRIENRERKKRWREENAERNKDNDLRSRVLKRASSTFGEKDSPEKRTWVEEEFNRRREKRIAKQKKDDARSAKDDEKKVNITEQDPKLVKSITDIFNIISVTGLKEEPKSSLVAASAATAAAALSHFSRTNSDLREIATSVSSIMSSLFDGALESGQIERFKSLSKAAYVLKGGFTDSNLTKNQTSAQEKASKSSILNRGLMKDYRLTSSQPESILDMRNLNLNGHKRKSVDESINDNKKQKSMSPPKDPRTTPHVSSDISSISKIASDIDHIRSSLTSSSSSHLWSSTHALKMPTYKKPENTQQNNADSSVKQEFVEDEKGPTLQLSKATPFISNKANFASMKDEADSSNEGSTNAKGLKRPGSFQRPAYSKPKNRSMGFPTLYSASFSLN